MADKPPAPRCAVCGKPVEPPAPHRPFCSARCRQVDLGRWLAGDYVIPGEDLDRQEDDTEDR
ncbi:DNA gyrase inhibitor YacG [Belnapia sp. T18]|uniref:DNA gyrase inhibitor YacG n=1 Tax=Belnapia arida TaxID=2804533 RepID=A0ABS1U0U1_9PROT|nr:DNA gyrase inhibitor YacG [Belnapia arida]MBL6078135.1 DNA gyrase inhibitor YacG [Belnapia arida]